MSENRMVEIRKCLKAGRDLPSPSDLKTEQTTKLDSESRLRDWKNPSDIDFRQTYCELIAPEKKRGSNRGPLGRNFYEAERSSTVLAGPGYKGTYNNT